MIYIFKFQFIFLFIFLFFILLPLLILLFILYSLCKEQRWNEFICKIKGIMNSNIKNEVDLNKDKKMIIM